jgi:hypothetical protein
MDGGGQNIASRHRTGECRFGDTHDAYRGTRHPISGGTQR